MLGSQMLMGDGWILAAGDGIIFFFFNFLFKHRRGAVCLKA